MALEMKRMKMSIEDIFGILPVDQDEIEIPRTNDLGNISDPNWSSPMKRFSLGLQNSKETILSNMIAKKTNNFNQLSPFLDYMISTQNMIFDLIYKLLDKIGDK